MTLKYKVVLGGSKDVGKSSLIARFCDNVFDENMQDTIGVAFKRKIMKIQKEKQEMRIELNLWDFGGEERYRALFPSYVNGAVGALILYDTTRKETLNDINNWVDIIDTNQENVIKVVIGTKKDLKDQRQISKAYAEKITKGLNCHGDVLETSAKTGENVEEAFKCVAEEIIQQKLQECENCGEFFSKKLRHCNYCGANALKVTFS